MSTAVTGPYSKSALASHVGCDSERDMINGRFTAREACTRTDGAARDSLQILLMVKEEHQPMSCAHCNEALRDLL